MSSSHRARAGLRLQSHAIDRENGEEGKVGHRLDALSRDEDQFARIFRPIRAAVVIGVKMLDLEARTRQLVVQLETKEIAHLERVHQALLRAPRG